MFSKPAIHLEHSQRLQALPADAPRMAAVEAFIGSGLTTRPDLGAKRIPAITDGSKRSRWVQKISSH